MRLSHYPLRAAIGAFFLNSGLSKWGLEGEPVEALHGMAVGAVPQLDALRPGVFARLLAGAEIATGTALLLPVVPSALAGAGLTGFGAGLIRLYWATPGMRAPGSFRPTQQGVPLAKDIWLVGAGLTLILDDLIGGRRGRGHRDHRGRHDHRGHRDHREHRDHRGHRGHGRGDHHGHGDHRGHHGGHRGHLLQGHHGHSAC